MAKFVTQSNLHWEYQTRVLPRFPGRDLRRSGPALKAVAISGSDRSTSASRRAIGHLDPWPPSNEMNLWDCYLRCRRLVTNLCIYSYRRATYICMQIFDTSWPNFLRKKPKLRNRERETIPRRIAQGELTRTNNSFVPAFIEASFSHRFNCCVPIAPLLIEPVLEWHRNAIEELGFFERGKTVLYRRGSIRRLGIAAGFGD